MAGLNSGNIRQFSDQQRHSIDRSLDDMQEILLGFVDRPHGTHGKHFSKTLDGSHGALEFMRQHRNEFRFSRICFFGRLAGILNILK